MNYAIRFADVDRHAEAFATAQEAVQIYRHVRQIHGPMYNEDISRVEQFAISLQADSNYSGRAMRPSDP